MERKSIDFRPLVNKEKLLFSIFQPGSSLKTFKLKQFMKKIYFFMIEHPLTLFQS